MQPGLEYVKNVSLTNVSRVQTSLWNLLLSTRDLDCTDARDRVYSLLSTTTSGHQGIRADYKISVSRLLNIILRNWHSDLRPSSLQQVSDQCSLLADIFRVDRNTMYTLSNPDMSESNYYPGHHLQEFEWKEESYEAVKIWAEFYNHKQVCRLLQAEIVTRGVSRNQVQDDMPPNRIPDTTTTASPSIDEFHPPATARHQECGNSFWRGFFPSIWSAAS